MNTAQKIIKNVLSLFISGTIAQLLGFVVIMHLARVLGPAGFGKISFAMALVVYFTVIVNMGLPLLGTREIARRKEGVKTYLGKVVILRLGLAVLSYCLLVLVTLLLNKGPVVNRLILLYGLGLIPSALLLDWVFQGVEKMEYIGLSSVITALIYITLIINFIKDSNQILLIPCSQVTAALVGAIFLFAVFQCKWGKIKVGIDLYSLRNLFRQALPIGLTFILNPIIIYIDTLMLGFMRTDAEVGYYNAAGRIIIVLLMISVVYQNAVYPVVSHYYRVSWNSLKVVQAISAKLLITTALPIAVGGTILAGPIMKMLYGVKYDPAITIFRILIWYFAMEYMYSIFARGLLACNREKERLIIIAVLTVACVILNLVFIPIWGMVGAAIGTVLTRILGFFLFHREFNKVILLPIAGYIVRPLLASLVMGLLLWGFICFFHLNVILLILAGGMMYLLTLIMVGGVNKEDLKLISRIFDGTPKQVDDVRN